eukprot:gene5790-9611_t
MLCIDFGTDNCFVGTFQNDKVEVIPTEDGIRAFSCDVSYTEEDVLVGNPSKIQSIRNYKNHIKELEDLEFELEIKTVKFSEVLKVFFHTIKKRSEDYLGQEMKDCFLSVSDNFEDFKMTFIKNCLSEIELNVIKFIKTSVANTISFNLDDASENDQTVFIFDLGVNKLHLSLVEIQDGLITIKKSKEYKEKNLAGEDFDNILFDYAIKEFKKKNKLSTEDIEDGFFNNKKSTQKLRLTCEKAKITLSNGQKANFDIEALYDGFDYFSNITKSRFDMLSSIVIRNIIEKSKEFLGEDKFDEIYLAGGTSSIPKVQTEIYTAFEKENKQTNQKHQLNESVIIGLCIESSLYEKEEESNKQKEIYLNPFDLNIKNEKNEMISIISKDQILPFSTSINSSNSGLLNLYQDEDLIAEIPIEKESKIDFHLSENGELKINFNGQEIKV